MKKLTYLILPIITIIFEALPFGVICNVPAVEGEAFNDKFSYFSSIPVDYNYFAPFMTAILTCIFTLLLIIYCFSNKKQLLNIAKYLVCASAGFAFGAGLKVYKLRLGFAMSQYTKSNFTYQLSLAMDINSFLK